MDNILFLEILPRLPAKSLIRFKSVSKSFKSTISSPHFAKLYLHYYHHPLSSSNFLTLPADHRIICYELDSTPTTQTFTWDDHSSLSIVGSCNGLICILIRGFLPYLSIINPSTRICNHINNVSVYHGRGLNIGFAFDFQNLDFKIVLVSDMHNDKAVKTRVTKVYSLNKNSTRKVETALATDSMEERHGGVLIDNRLLHWMFWVPSLSKRRIGCFDVCNDKWVDDVLLPYYYYDIEFRNYLLDFGVFDECLFSSFENCVENCFDVWVMKEYGVQDSWVKYLSIPYSYGLREGVLPVACRRGFDEVLIRHRHESLLVWYNLVDGEISEAEFGEGMNFSNLEAYMCDRSLIDLPGGELFEDL